MKAFVSLAVCSLFAAARAQTAPGFPIQVETNLRVEYFQSYSSVIPDGILFPQGFVASAPTVFGPRDSLTWATYLLIMIDQDGSYDNGTTFQVLHYLQPNLVGFGLDLTIQPQSTNASTAVGAPYLTPGPPYGGPPHRYNLLLYEQPKDFTIPAAYQSINPPASVNDRAPFDLAAFASAAGLAEPIAANWFQVLNSTAQATSSILSAYPAPTDV